MTTTDQDAAIGEIKGLVRVSAVPTRFRHTVHAYAAIPAFSRDDRRLLYLGFDDEARGHIVVQDLATGHERVLAQTTGFDYHTAASQRWVLHDTAVVFRTGAEHGVSQAMIVPADGSGPARPLDIAPRLGLRHICDDSVHAIGAARLGPNQDKVTIVLVDLDAGTYKPLVTADDAAALLPRELVAPDVTGYEVSHPVANPAVDRVFFKLMRTRSDGRSEYNAFFVLELDSGRLICQGNRISGHPVWMPDGRRILNVMSPRDGSDNRWLVYQDAATGEAPRVVDLPIEGPGHPTVTPDGRYIATDAFTADGQASPVYLIDTQKRTVREIVRLPHRFVGGMTYDPNRVTRGQPHPIWSHAADRLVVNCNFAGARMRLLTLSDLPFASL